MNYPRYVQLYLSIKCNQKCIFCFNNNINPHLFSDMSPQKSITLVDILAKRGIQEIDVLGGEPLLIPWIDDFISYATRLRLHVTISTNGSMVDAINRLSNLHTQYLNIGFSIHGFSDTHNFLTGSDSFEKAIECIKIMISIGKKPHVKSILRKENKAEIYDFMRFLRKIGVTKYYMMYEDIIGRTKEQDIFSFPEFWNFYLKLKNNLGGQIDVGAVVASGFYAGSEQLKGRCNGGIKKLAIMPDGSVYPCNLFAGFKEFKLGNIFNDDYEKILINPILDLFKKYSGNNKCKKTDCELRLNCRGGCPAHSIFFYNSIEDIDPRCKHSKNKYFDNKYFI